MSGTEGLKRGFEVTDSGGPISHAGRRRRDGPRVRRHRQPGRRARAGQGGQVLSDPPPAAAARRPVDVAAGADDRHQGHRSDLPVPEGRQGRRVRRRRRRQDRRHHGADQQHRQAARRRVGVRRRRRAHARRQRPLPRNVAGRRHQPEGPRRVEDRAGLRPDERAAGRAPARRALAAWPSPSTSATRRTRTCCSSSTTSSASRRPAPKCRRCSAARRARSAISRRWPPRWARCRSASPRPRKARSRRSRRSTCRPTT